MAELHVNEGRNGEAVALLERYLKDWADDSLHVKLAQVFAATNMLQDALSHYEAALRFAKSFILHGNLSSVKALEFDETGLSEFLLPCFATIRERSVK